MVRPLRFLSLAALSAAGMLLPLASGRALAVSALSRVPTCSASALRAFAGWQGVAGTIAGTVVLRNEGKDTCILAGFPRVALTTPWGALHVQQQRSPAAPAGFPVESTELVPGQASDVFLQWENLCETVSAPVRIAITLSNSGHLGAQPPHQPSMYGGTIDPRCGQPRKHSFLLVSSFQPDSNPAVVGLLSYYDLINRREYADAYAMTVDPSTTQETFAAGYRETVHTAVARIAVPTYRVHRANADYACIGLLLSATQSSSTLRLYGGWVMTEVRDGKVASVVLGGSRMHLDGDLAVPSKETCAATIPGTGGRG